MLIQNNAVQEALQVHGMKADEMAIIGLERNLFVQGKARFYQNFPTGRFATLLIRDRKGRITALKPQRVA